MSGDLHDWWYYPEEEAWYDTRTAEAAHMMEAGLCIMGLFYLICNKPLKLFGCDNPEMVASYDTTGFPVRWPFFFKTWREYENTQYDGPLASTLHCFSLSIDSLL